MLSGGSGQLYRQILAGSGGQFVRRVEVWRGGTRIDQFADAGVPVLQGSVSADLANRVTRQLQLDVPASLFPATYGDLLDPRAGTELVVYAGWRSGASPAYLWPVFTGPIVSCSRQRGSVASVAVEATDRAERIVQAKFLAPVPSGAGALVTTRIKDLINDVVPDAGFVVASETGATVPALSWESDRAAALDQLAESVGCLWYQLAGGTFTVRQVPWYGDLGAPVVTLTAGICGTSVSVTITCSGVYTACRVVGEAANGDSPVTASALDLNPVSQTYALGPLGVRVVEIRNDTVSSAGQAESLAKQRLRRSGSSAVAVTSLSLFDPSLELGDTVLLRDLDGREYLRSLASFTAPLAGTPMMSATWKSAGEVDDG